MLKRKAILAGLLIAILIPIMAVGCGDGDSGGGTKTLVFAMEAPFSGPYAAWGLMAEPSCELAAEDINSAGGIKVGNDTYNVEIRTYDNAMDPTVAATITRKAVIDDGVSYISIISTDEAGAVNELCNSRNVALFVMAPARNLIGVDSPYTFQTYYEIGEAEEVMLDYLAESEPEAKRIAVIAPDDTRGHIAGEDFKEIADSKGGFEVVDVLYAGAEETDFYSLLTNLLTKDVDVINVSASGPEVQGNVIKQARELGFTGIFMHPDTLDVPTVSEICGMENLEGNIAASQWVEMPTEVGKEWAERYVEAYGSLQGWTAGLYDNIMLLKLAIEKAGTIETEEVVKALGEVSYEGCMGEARFIGEDIPSIGTNSVMTVKINVVQIQNGKEVDVYSGYGSFWRTK